MLDCITKKPPHHEAQQEAIEIFPVCVCAHGGDGGARPREAKRILILKGKATTAID